ncbi:cation-translocating P-type ATPase [Actinomadura livida]|uniref:Cation-transporting ATPase F n=1 Tax=Actinomadura livida TaxID=79909 RepID=A0A7W7IAX8_9ACTN|nr:MULTISPECIES: HAD-IC family P-type ATPase [Actinomadura]MBB4773747.1 cation-transporting ATPase F [Actinomadura catellatispora]GGU10437.1 putative cation-transporting ATPase F [Actinomadura livida]
MTGTGAPHGLPAGEVVRALDTDAGRGLTAAEADERLAREGPNTLPAAEGRGAVLRFLAQFHSPLIYVLLGAAGVTALMGEHVDALVILGVVIVNAVVGFVQESRAEQALGALAVLAQTSATVVRDGRRRGVPAAELVRGDLVELAAGDKVPADLRLLRADELAADESALTGESVPVAKDPAATPGAELGDRTGMAFSGTLVTRGQGAGVVVATGARTELGDIHRLVRGTRAVRTPLTRKITQFSKIVTVGILVLAAGTFLLGVARGRGTTEMLTAAVALAVGAIPEGLPAVMTVTLALGVARMARRGAIVRHLPAVETLGGTTVICTDKTGTLTRNQMTVTAVVAGGREYTITGSGYAPDGAVHAGGEPVEPSEHPALHAVLTAGLACNDAELVQRDEGWQVAGDPTEGALVTSAAKAGIDSVPERLATLPFNGERRFMATLQADGVVHVKGPVERILELCDDQAGPDGEPEPLDKDDAVGRAEAFGEQALRVLAFARAHTAAGDLDELPRLTFVGLQAMIDPPRTAAAQAVRSCHRAGVDVKMITGDHAATARAIGAHVGLEGEVMTGAELDADVPPERIRATTVFARVSPEQKLRLVQALQDGGHVVAMTGDGVNDAPALKQADIGVAMGRTGTDVAKESADMVLTDDDFASIEKAVEEGRGVFDNLVKFIVWALPANIGLGLVLVAAIVADTELPILPLQVLWLNMTAILVLGLPFAVEPKDDAIMDRPPRDPSLPLITRAMTTRILVVSAVLLAGAFGLQNWERANGASPDVAQTIVVNVFALTLLTYMFNCLSLDRPLLWRGVRRNPWVGVSAAALIAIQLVYTYAPAMNEVFGSAPLDLAHWLRIVAVAVLSYALLELVKRVQRGSS